jgi:ketosteroid isomerase-like protein
MNQPVITLLALATVVLANTPALAQTKWEYNRYAPDAEVVANLEEQWVAALLNRDTATLQRLRADEFTLIAPNGRICRKATELSLLLSPDFKLESFVLQGGNVRVYTGGVVVTGTVVVKGTAKDTNISGQYRFTDVYEPRGNSWQAVFSQWTKVEEKGAAKEPTENPGVRAANQ